MGKEKAVRTGAQHFWEVQTGLGHLHLIVPEPHFSAVTLQKHFANSRTRKQYRLQAQAASLALAVMIRSCNQAGIFSHVLNLTFGADEHHALFHRRAEVFV